MIDKKLAKKVLDVCISTGCEFAELFVEDTIKNSIELTKGRVSKAVTNQVFGCGLRLLDGNGEIYGYTNDISEKGLCELAQKLAGSFDKKPLGINYELKETINENKHKIKKAPSDVSNEEKISYLLKCYNAVKDYSSEIHQIICNLNDSYQKVLIANTNGQYIKDERCIIRIAASVAASADGKMETAHDTYGRNQGYEFLDDANLEEFALKIAKAAITMLHADDIMGGKMTVVVHNAFGGVLLHEACVHSLEATSVAKGASVFANKLGEKIASDVVTAIDDGTIVNAWGSINVDDEGNPAQKNILIENGILKTYLVDYRNSKIMNHPITGSGRRESYKFSPTSRMTNTFFAPGESTFEEIIAKTEYGLFAKKMGGGSVDPSTGEFNFAVSEGYMIENGKITKPVRGATLIGSGAEVLMNVDMIADNLEFGYGMCGSLSGSVPTCVGQPTIRVKNLTVGGKGGKK